MLEVQGLSQGGLVTASEFTFMKSRVGPYLLNIVIIMIPMTVSNTSRVTEQLALLQDGWSGKCRAITTEADPLSGTEECTMLDILSR